MVNNTISDLKQAGGKWQCAKPNHCQDTNSKQYYRQCTLRQQGGGIMVAVFLQSPL